MPFTPDEMRKLAIPGEQTEGLSAPPPPDYQPHQLSKRLGPKKVEQILQKYQAGESARSLAQQHGVSTSAVVNLLRDNCITVKKRRVSDTEARQMAKEYRAGATMRELESKYDLSHGAVGRALHRVGVEMRAKAPRKKTV